MSMNQNIEQNRMPEVLITNWNIDIIKELVESEDYRQDLTEALLNNKLMASKDSDQIYEFYTDGSLVDRGKGRDQTKMGAAWLQVTGATPHSIFQSGVHDWPSSSRAEATAILTTLLIVPRGKEVIIHTDSQNCIDIFKKISKADPKIISKRWLKINNWSIWHNILEVKSKKDIRLNQRKSKLTPET